MSYSKAIHNFNKIINNALYSILKGEFPEWKIVFAPDFRERDMTKKEYLRFYENGSESISKASTAETRDYYYTMSLYFQTSSIQYNKSFEDKLSELLGHLYFFLMSRQATTLSSGYKWHDLTLTSVSPVIYGFDDEMEEIAHIDIEVTITRTNDLEYNAGDIYVVEEITIE